MSGKRAVIALIAALLAFGYVFTLNPGSVEFQIYPGTRISTSLALVLFLFFLGGLGLAMFSTAFQEALRSFQFWRHQKADARRDEAKRLLIRGRGQAALGRTRAARKLMQRAYRKAAGETLVSLDMARVEIADGQLDSAERRLKALLDLDPRSPEVLALLFETYRKKGNFEGQLAVLTRRLEVEPNHEEALLALRELYVQAKNWAEAVRVQTRILALASSRHERNDQRRRLTELRLRHAAALSPGAARGVLEQVIREDESFAPAYAALGEVLLKSGEPETAVQIWLRGYHATEREGLLLMVERVRVDQGRSEDMLKLYKKLGRKGGTVQLLRARLLLSLERSEEALQLLEKSGPGVSDTPLGRLLAGEALYRLRSCDEAVRAFREGIYGDEEGATLSFVCETCGESSPNASSVCPSCGALGALDIDSAHLLARPKAPAPA